MIEQFLKFCIVGGSGVFVDFGITYLCKEWLRLNKYVANSLGFLCASTTNYILNRIWTFHNENPDITGQYLRFLGIAAVFFDAIVIIAVRNLCMCYKIQGLMKIQFSSKYIMKYLVSVCGIFNVL